ncbi:Os12g0578000, partial [Oryza sativa Japonica Group]
TTLAPSPASPSSPATPLSPRLFSGDRRRRRRRGFVKWSMSMSTAASSSASAVRPPPTWGAPSQRRLVEQHLASLPRGLPRAAHVRELHAQVLKQGLHLNPRAAARLVSAYALLRLLPSSRRVFDAIRDPHADAFLANTMLRAYALGGRAARRARRVLRHAAQGQLHLLLPHQGALRRGRRPGPRGALARRQARVRRGHLRRERAYRRLLQERRVLGRPEGVRRNAGAGCRVLEHGYGGDGAGGGAGWREEVV